MLFITTVLAQLLFITIIFNSFKKDIIKMRKKTFYSLCSIYLTIIIFVVIARILVFSFLFQSGHHIILNTIIIFFSLKLMKEFNKELNVKGDNK